MLSYCIFWFTIIFYIILLCESASLRRESSFFSGGRWRPGRPLKRSLSFGTNKDTLEGAGQHPKLQAPFGVAETLGPQILDEQQIPIIYLLEGSNVGGNKGSMLFINGFEAEDLPLSGDEGGHQSLASIDEKDLVLMLKSGENYSSNQATIQPQQQQPFIYIPSATSKPPIQGAAAAHATPSNHL